VTVDEENGAELFYYFIESEGDPRRDPVVVWLTGGDRCTVLSALFFEIGQQLRPMRLRTFLSHSKLPVQYSVTQLLMQAH
jgi:carboxypeptidase C (cathepsin A)